MTASTSAPVLSIVLTAQHVAADDFETRVLAPLRFNHQQLLAHGVSHEFVLVVGDSVWRADLAAAIAILSETISVLAVDPRYEDAFRVDGSDSIELIARNAGIRRACGTFILSTSCSVCIGRRVLRRMADRTLESGILYRAPRVDIKVDTSRDPFSWGTFEQPRAVIGRAKALQPPMYLGDAADFILLDRESLHRLRGFNEIHGFNGVSADEFVVKAHAHGYPIQQLGAPVYHVHHESSTSGIMPKLDDLAGDVARRGWGAARMFRNPDTWGLSAAPERQLGPHCLWLEFDVSAVPALVDLNRVELQARDSEIPLRDERSIARLGAAEA